MTARIRILIYLFIVLLAIMQIRFGIFYKRTFTPRTPEEIAAAPGDLSGLDGRVARAFMPLEGFSPITKAALDDYECWLVNHYEPGQSFAEYASSAPNAVDEKRRSIYIQPIGGVTGETGLLLEKLRAFTERFFAMPAKVLPSKEMTARSRINSHTKKTQLLTGDLLRELKKSVPEDAYCVLGVTTTDLYPNAMWNFVFGQALLARRVGVYSLARYDPEFFDEKRGPDHVTEFLRRSLKVLAHEAFHMFGVYHCVYYKCLMNGSNSLKEADSAPMFLCPVCLRKLYHAIKFDPGARYAGLREFYGANGMTAEVEWIDRRLEAMKKK